MPIQTTGYAVKEAGKPLVPHAFEHRDLKEHDIHIKIHWSGVCHSDIHQGRAEWSKELILPMIPGHEIAGIVEAVGSKVTRHAVGDKVGVGVFVDSCGSCGTCSEDFQMYCSKAAFTYNSRNTDGTPTYGGYARDVVVTETHVFKIPESLDFKTTAPLLCAGVTVYAPMKRWGMDQPGKKIGVVGFGGLGHLAVKFGVSFGNEITVITRSAGKVEAATRFGAKSLISTDSEAMAKHAGHFDFLVDTVAAHTDMKPFMDLLGRGGVLVNVGIPPAADGPMPVPYGNLLRMQVVTGSLVGGLKMTQDMLDYCGEKKIQPDVEIIPMSDVNMAWERASKSDVKFRFVIDCSTVPAAQ